ncbi:hypothetical protein MMC16_005388 [Acarospora aff. strigata]|nr:hypothetical protein [Acarospora aff. strigata]
MVLDESTTPTSDFTTDYTPDSDYDPYSSPSPAKISYQIDTTSFPRPPFLIGPLFGYTSTYCANVIYARINNSALLLRRPPTQDEATALAYHSAKMLSIAPWGSPLGLAGGWYRAYATREHYRFPFMTPSKETFNPNVVRYFGVRMEGRQAQLFWHSLRGTAYGFIGIFIGHLLVQTYAATVAAVGERQDPRLKDLIRAIQEKARETTAAIIQEHRGQAGRGQRRDPTGQGQRSASELWKNHRMAIGADDDVGPGRSMRGPAGDADDASPSAGGDMSDPYGSNYSTAEEAGSLAMSDGNVLSDRQMRNQEARQRPNPATSPTRNTAGTFRIDKVERQPRSFDSDSDSYGTDDDVSPAGGQGPASMDSGGSAWARIRQQSSASPGSSTGGRGGSFGGRRSSRRPEESTVGDGFTFSDEAKDEAQRAFDERVEKERRGGDF